MATDYGARFSKAVGCTRHAMGGAAEGLGIGVLDGDTEMIYTFDDFNGVVLTDEFDEATNWEPLGWTLTEDAGVAGVGAQVSMNDPVEGTGTLDYDSCIRIFGGTEDSSAGNMLLDLYTNGYAAPLTGHHFPHMWIPATTHVSQYGSAAAATALDGSTWMFACRIGFRADITTTGAGDWESGVYIGWAGANQTTIMDHDTCVLTTAINNLHGFHICNLGEIYGVSKRIAGDAITAAVGNYTTILPAGSVDGTVANGATTAGDTMWFDLALRMDITDQSDDDNNGTTTFYWRKVLPNRPLGDWTRHPTVLTNETPNLATPFVPAIELVNGTTAGIDPIIFIDWWSFARNRMNRQV